MNALEIRNLTKEYEGFFLDNVSLTLPQGCIMGLIGENGAGKSTVIKLILDIIRPDSGTITLLGKDSRDKSCLVKDDIGVVLDDVGLPADLTPNQLRKVMKNIFHNWDDDAYSEYLDRFSLPRGKRFEKFSRGMKMKLGIAVALSHRSSLLLLDEPTAALDPVIRDEILDIFIEFTRDETHSILISSHIVSDLEKLCDYIAFLHKGKLLLCEEKDVLRERYGAVHCTQEQLALFPEDAVLGKKENPYGVEAIVRRDAILPEMQASPADIEQLFVSMVKGAGVR